MIRELPAHLMPAVSIDTFWRAGVSDYLEALNTYAPGLDVTADRAVAIGLVITERTRSGELSLDTVRTLGEGFGFEPTELEALIAAAFTWLSPGDLPLDLRHLDPENSFGRSPFDEEHITEPDVRTIHDEGLAEDA